MSGSRITRIVQAISKTFVIIFWSETSAEFTFFNEKGSHLISMNMDKKKAGIGQYSLLSTPTSNSFQANVDVFTRDYLFEDLVRLILAGEFGFSPYEIRFVDVQKSPPECDLEIYSSW